MDKVSSFLTSLIPSNLNASLDIVSGPQQLFVLLGGLFVFLYGMSVGKTRALISLLAIYIAFSLTTVFPYFNQVIDMLPPTIEPHMLQIILFLTLYIAIFIILNNTSLHSRLSSAEISFWQVLAISVLQIGLLGSVLASYVPVKESEKLLGNLKPFFATSQALFFWAVGSLAILPFLKRTKKRAKLA